MGSLFTCCAKAGSNKEHNANIEAIRFIHNLHGVFLHTCAESHTPKLVTSNPWQPLAKSLANGGPVHQLSYGPRQAGSQSISIGRMRSTVLASLLVLSTVVGLCSAQDKEDANAAAKVVALLEKSGHNYTKVKDGVWEINFTGDNLKEFSVRFALVG